MTGALGGSILGRHLTFEPRVKLGREIAPVASAMIDISDGLSRDLGHICKSSGVGAIVESGLVPIHPDAMELSRRDGVPAWIMPSMMGRITNCCSPAQMIPHRVFA